jgi:predicted esterase
MIHSASSLIVGEAESVGVKFFKATNEHPPIRLFYPAEEATSHSKSGAVGWFEEDGASAAAFLLGYMYIAVNPRENSTFVRFALAALSRLLSMVLPLGWRCIPGVYKGASYAPSSTKRPVVVFSHGLTGTGQENALLLAAWAKQGFVVISIHHTDGSASRVELKDGSFKFYDHGPPFSDYDPTFRPRQVEQRAKEMIQACEFLSSNECPKDIRENVDMKQVIASGFSYGAATVARAVTLSDTQQTFCAAVLLDGWFFIDVSESAGVEFEFPQEAFAKPGGLGSHIPSLFVNSEQFQGIPKLYQATCKLAQGSKMHVLTKTGHQNFCDVVFWSPISFLRRLFGKAIGPADPVSAYRELIELTSTFMKNLVQ